MDLREISRLLYQIKLTNQEINTLFEKETGFSLTRYLKPGCVVGASDKLGEEPVTDPISPLMVGTTIAELAGVSSQKRAELKALEGGRVIHELL